MIYGFLLPTTTPSQPQLHAVHIAAAAATSSIVVLVSTVVHVSIVVFVGIVSIVALLEKS